LLSGLGPYIKNEWYLEGTLFDPNSSQKSADFFNRVAGRPMDLRELVYQGSGDPYRVLRPRRGKIPNLTTYRLRGVLERSSIDHDFIDLEEVWAGTAIANQPMYDIVALSTTFICNFQTLLRAVIWILQRFSGSILILGGQYSNLKFRRIMEAIPEVDYVIRGDAEEALPRLVEVINTGTEIDGIPNLVWRSGSSCSDICQSAVRYVDFDAYPSPVFNGDQAIIPYESMRGCPYDCKFCSYPAASPVWRVKSAETIVREWKEYVCKNKVKLIKAMDSTFTIPKDRFLKLLGYLPEVGVEWEAYARADAIENAETVRLLEAAHCKSLSIGFESMCDSTLQKMNKKVSAKQNRRAFALLDESNIDCRISFIVGFPGETPEDYELTHRFIVDDFRGRFLLSVFSIMDETMPVWDDASLYRIEVTDASNAEYGWKHQGMSSDVALNLWKRTVNEARWKNDEGVLSLWQALYENPLIPELSVEMNLRIEKLVERLAFLGRDFADLNLAKEQYLAAIKELNSYDITLADS
jgi:hypothetical protein